MLSCVVHCASSSRASTGSTSAVRPRPWTWLSFSFVETYTVVPMLRSARPGEAAIGRRREQVAAEQQRGVDASLGGRLDAGQRVQARAAAGSVTP